MVAKPTIFQLLVLGMLGSSCVPPTAADQLAAMASACDFRPGAYDLAVDFTGGTCGFAGREQHHLAISFDGAYLEVPVGYGLEVKRVDAIACSLWLVDTNLDFMGNGSTQAEYDFEIGPSGGGGVLRVRGWLNCDEVLEMPSPSRR